MKLADKTRPQTSTAPSGNLAVALALLVGAICAVYSNSLHGPFVFDDRPSIVENQSIRQLGSLQVLVASPDAVTTTGRPAVNLSLAINYAVGKLAVTGYHAVNLAIHVLAALVLFGLVRRTLLLPALSARFGSASTGLALTVALLWAVHPLDTESVTYIVQRAEAMMGLFYLLTLYGLVRAANAQRPHAWYAVAASACVAGMASKEVMVSAPLVALLYDRIFISGSCKQSLRRRWPLWAALAASWVILALLVSQSQHRGGSAGFGLGMSSWQYARRQFGCILHYLALSVWPSPLVLDYGNAAVRDAAPFLPSAIGVLVLVAATVTALAVRPTWGFLGVCFFAILAPTSSVVPLAGQVEAEHRMYLPLAAVVVAIVLAAHQLLVRLGRRFRLAAVALIATVAVGLGLGTYRRNQVYQSALTLWDSNVRNGPVNYRAHYNRGNAYMAKGQLDLALRDFEKVVELHARDPKAYNDRGNAYSATGRYAEAIEDYDRAIRLKPDFADPYNGRGTAHGNQGAVEAAVEDFTAAIRLDPRFAEAYFNRGNALGSKGDVAAAIRDYDKAIAARSDYADAYNSRGRAYDSKGEFDAAIKDYDQAIALQPDHADAYNNRGAAYDGKGQTEAALRDYDKAIALRPDFAEAFNNRGNTHQAKQRYQAAIEAYTRAIALKPDFAGAYYNRAIARAQVKAYDLARADLKAFADLGGKPSPALLDLLAKSTLARPASQ